MGGWVSSKKGPPKNRRFFGVERWFIMALIHPHLHPPPSRGRYGGGGLLGLKWIDKGLDVRYMRYCYMAYTEVRSQRSEVGLQTGVSDFRFPYRCPALLLFYPGQVTVA